MSRRRVSQTSGRPAAEPRRRDATADRESLWPGLICGMLFFTRFLVPTESADQGETLWIVAGWLAFATVAALWTARLGTFRLRVGPPEFAVGTIALGHILSALVVLGRGGQARAAVNMLWEWIGIVIAFVMLRHVFRTIDGRRQLMSLLIGGGVLLSGLGIWQHYVWYPQIASSYLEHEQLSQSAKTGGLSRAQQQRLEELQRSLSPELLNLGAQQQASLRQRIVDSTEPFGRFALANTLGGLLAVILVLLIAGAVGGWKSHTATTRGLFLALIALVGFTLILTKSRTAWLGTLGGLIVWFGITSQLLTRNARWRTWLLAVAAVGGIGVGVAALAFATGLLDRFVFSEAPKSVLYRVQYWTGTAGVLAEHPVFGPGPGNFRSHYLKYKLPEASEEISDPHNFILDAWCSGGLIALAGLLWLGILAVRRTIRPAVFRREPRLTPEQVAKITAASSSDLRWLIVSGSLACFVTLAMAYLFEARDDTQLLVMAFAWLPAAWLTARTVRLGMSAWNPSDYGAAATAAGTTLILHLCGAGGMEFPVVVLLLLAVWFVLGDMAPFATAAAASEETSPMPSSERRGLLTSVVCALTGLLCLGTAWRPVVMARMETLAGNTAFLLDGNADRAIRHFSAAAEQDSLDPEPLRRLASVHISLWQSSASWTRSGDSSSSDNHFTAALDALEGAMARDPDTPHLDRLLGDMWLSRWRRQGDPSSAGKAIDAFRKAAGRYPNSSEIRFELAEAFDAAGRIDEAAGEAERSLQLDDINRAAHHFDKTFTEERRDRLRQLVSAGSSATSSSQNPSPPTM